MAVELARGAGGAVHEELVLTVVVDVAEVRFPAAGVADVAAVAFLAREDRGTIHDRAHYDTHPDM